LSSDIFCVFYSIPFTSFTFSHPLFNMTKSAVEFGPMPDAEGMFGAYGGQLVPPHLKAAMDEINAAVSILVAPSRS
jgi:hypothetical protein